MADHRISPRLNLTKVSFGGNSFEARTKPKIPNLRIPTLSPQQPRLPKAISSRSKRVDEYQLSTHEDYFPTITSGQSDRAHYQRDKSSQLSRTFTKGRIQGTMTSRLDTSKNMSSQLFQSEKHVTTLSTEGNQENQDEGGLGKMIQALKGFVKTEDTTVVSVDGVRRKVAVRPAKRIILSLIESLKALSNPKTKSIVLGSPMSRDLADEQYIIVESVNSVVDELVRFCEKGIGLRRSKIKLDGLMKEMCEMAQRNENAELSVCCIYLHAKIYVARNEHAEAVDMFRLYGDQAVAHRLVRDKLKACKGLGRCFQELKNYRASLYYFTKFLQVSWYLNSRKHELIAYDYIGLQYYYLGQLEKANYYHAKMTGGHLEPDSSNLKKVGIGKIKLKLDKQNHQTKQTRRRAARMKEDPMERNEEDDLREISSREEDFELPIPVAGQQDDKGEDSRREEEVTKMGKEKRANSETGSGNLKGVFKKKKIPEVLVGLMRAKIAQLAKEKERDRHKEANGEPRKDFLSVSSLEKTKSLTARIMPKLPSHIKAKPNEPIIVSHLSRNRQLKNFTETKMGAMLFIPIEEQPVDWSDMVDTKAMEKIKKIFEKFKMNLLVVKQTLESFRSYL